jgi:hypothetical protein
MQELYRANYEGEYVVTSLKIKNGKREQTREFVDNPLKIESISGRAVCVSKGAGSQQFPLHMLSGRQGLLDSLAVHSYTTGGLYTQVESNFHVTFNTDLLNDLIKRDLTEKIMVYTSTTQCLKHPGEFFIIPYGYKTTEEAVAAYLAAFDGHTEVYLVGYDEYTLDGLQRRDTMINSVSNVIETYSGTKFYHCIHQGNTPIEWKKHKNLSTMTINEFRSKCDISNGYWLRK